MEEESLEFKELYDKIATTATELTYETSALAVAAVMNAVAMSIYKTTMSEEDYEKMAELIYELRHDVQKFGIINEDESGTIH